MTNADRIRAMTDEEMAKLWGVEECFCPPQKTVLSCIMADEKKMPTSDDCIACWLEWLRKEREA